MNHTLPHLSSTNLSPVCSDSVTPVRFEPLQPFAFRLAIVIAF